MKMQDEVLIENKLVTAIIAFYELPDREKAKTFVKEAFSRYCEEKNLNRKEVFDFVEKCLKNMAEFNKNIDPELVENLDKIVLTERERTTKKSSKKPRSRAKSDDDDAR